MAEMFECVACGEEFQGDITTGITDCRVCRRIHCEGCLNKDGLCVECSEEG